MPTGSRNVGVASTGLVNPLGEAELIQFFEGAVDGHQAEVGVQAAGLIEDILRVEGFGAAGQDFDDGPAGGG